MASTISSFPLFALLLASTSAAPLTALEKRQSTVRALAYSGAALSSVPDGSSFTYITSQINVPDTQFVSAEGSPGQIQKSAAWVGFGGGSQNSGGIMQTGCAFYNDGQDDKYTRCWYEFYPSPPVFYDGFSPSIGDTILLELYRNADTSTDASSYITNLSTGEQVSADFSAPDGHAVQGVDAEWIVENPAGKNDFVNFQKAFFEGCNTQTAAGNTYGPGDATYRIYNEFKDLGDGNGRTQWTNSFLPSDSEVEVDWTGPS